MRALPLAALLAFAAGSASATAVGGTGGATLARPQGTRALGLGEAFGAVEGGLDSAGSNPAGVARLARPVVQLQYTHGVVDDHFSVLSYGHPAPFGALFGGLTYYDAGTVNLQFANGTNERVNAEQDFVGQFGAAVKVGGALSAGAAAKLYRFRLADRATATGAAADLGAQLRLPLEGLSLGASARNLGPDVKFEQEGDPLPMEGRVGAAYLLDLARFDVVRDMEYSMSQFLFTLDGVQQRDDTPWLGLGLEMRMNFDKDSNAALRVGYKVNRPEEAPGVGVGVKEGRFFVDYAYGNRRSVTAVHHFTLGWQF